jgi:hypothetical protein
VPRHPYLQITLYAFWNVQSRIDELLRKEVGSIFRMMVEIREAEAFPHIGPRRENQIQTNFEGKRRVD